MKLSKKISTIFVLLSLILVVISISVAGNPLSFIFGLWPLYLIIFVPAYVYSLVKAKKSGYKDNLSKFFLFIIFGLSVFFLYALTDFSIGV